MKNKTYRFAVATAVLLALALVFVMPVAAYDTEIPAAVNGVINLNDDVVLNNNWTVSTNIVLNLNGHNITHEKECTGSYSMIQVNTGGSLTINGPGKISFKDTSGGDSSFGWGSYTISNYGGTLVVNGGTIEHLGQQNTPGNVVHMYCAIYQYSGSTTINDGVVSTPTYRSIRLWKGDLTINGGTFEGQVWVQTVDNSAELTVNGGAFSPRGGDGSSVYVEVANNNVEFSVTGGSFETKIGTDDASQLTGSITGGTFSAAAMEYTADALFNPDTPHVTNPDGTTSFGSSIPAPETPSVSSSSSGTPTPGAYYNYPRTTDNGGLVEFGTSKVVKSITLPAGSSGKVNLHIDSTAYWPLSVDSEFIFDISVDNLGEGTSYISFKIDESKLTALDITAADVGVYHNVNGEWVKLTVTYKIEDGDVIYTAETESFSPFKLVIEAGAATPAEEAVTPSEPVTPPTEEPTDEPTDVPGAELPEIPDIQDEPETPASPAPVLGLIAALGAAVVLRRK